MFRLIAPVDVRTRMGLDPALASAIDPVIDSYITSAQLRAETVLDTSFDVATITDQFLIDPSLIGDVVPNGRHRLYLSAGFLQSDTAVTVTPPSTLSWDNSQIVDNEKGLVYLPDDDETLIGSTFSITYKAGFDSTHPPPEWLKEVLISAIAPLLNATQPTNKSSDAKAFYDSVNQHIAAIMARHTRNPGLVIRPL